LAGGGAYSVPLTDSSYFSVFSSSGGNNPTPEQGLTWVLLPAVADANGNLTILDQSNFGLASSPPKAFSSGFQIQAVPEPATIGLLGSAGAALLAARSRRRHDGDRG
jgi:hypothetical protein